VIEAKGNNLGVGHGMQQALRYATLIDVPLVLVQIVMLFSSTIGPVRMRLLNRKSLSSFSSQNNFGTNVVSGRGSLHKPQRSLLKVTSMIGQGKLRDIIKSLLSTKPLKPLIKDRNESSLLWQLVQGRLIRHFR
jgi:hypothetical protein